MAPTPAHPMRPLSLCWHCDRLVDGHTSIDPDAPYAIPEPGAVSLCLYCGAVGVFDLEALIRPPTEEELGALEEDEGFMAVYFSFAWSRQHLMLDGSLMRGNGGPDR